MATWRHWAISMGLVCIMIVLSMLVTRQFLPCITFAFAGMLALLIYQYRDSHNKGLAIPFIVCVSLIIEGILLVSFNLTVRITDMYELAGKPVNDELPYIVQLSLTPVMAFVSGVFMLRRLGRGRFFRTRSGRSDVSIVQRMVWQETRYQARMLFMISIGVMIISWGYTYYSFSSMSINKPDRFFFVWLPVIVYFLSLLYLGFRCLSLWAFYSQNDPVMMLNPHRSSIVRYLIVSGNRLYLTKRRLEVKHSMELYFDTPVRLRTQFSDSYSVPKALELFNSYTGIDEKHIESLKFLFNGMGFDTDNNIFHFLCVLDSEDAVNDTRLDKGEWVSLDGLRRLDRDHKLSAELSSELVHIYLVAMAWKSYNIDGSRRYKIKNYRPTYSLSEINSWNVDFNDIRWLKVSRLNEDKPFFRLRRFINRITSPAVR